LCVQEVGCLATVESLSIRVLPNLTIREYGCQSIQIIGAESSKLESFSSNIGKWRRDARVLGVECSHGVDGARAILLAGTLADKELREDPS
jgi:hypothetical protein